MADIIAFVIVLAISIGLGIVLSWFMGVKLMKTEGFKRQVREVAKDYSSMVMDVSLETMKENQDKFKSTIEDLV